MAVDFETTEYSAYGNALSLSWSSPYTVVSFYNRLFNNPEKLNRKHPEHTAVLSRKKKTLLYHFCANVATFV